MVLYLTSSFIPYKVQGAREKAEPLDNYGFFDELKTEWPKDAKLLYVPCNPEKVKENGKKRQIILDIFASANISVSECKTLTEEDSANDMVAWSDVIFLASGHAPSQLAFMKRIGLKEALSGYDGVIIGQGAGAMNAAFYVYHTPELEGEAVDPNYVRFSDGLDLTNIQIIPHRDYIRERSVDGLNLIDDIVIPDSFGCKFYLISDGSYFKVKNGETSFFGKGEVIEDGVIYPIKPGKIIPFMSYVEQPVIRSLISEGYDMIFAVEKNEERCEVYHLDVSLWGIFTESRFDYKEICKRLSQTLVKEEQEIFLEQVRISSIQEELAKRGEFVRTVHVDYEDGRRAKNIRAKEVPGYPDWLMMIYIDITSVLDYDWMTDEYARTGFLDRAKLFLSELHRDDHYSLVFANVKGLKAVNELFGNQKGDLVIFQTRDALRKYLHPVLMGRLEGDNFALITADENLVEKNIKSMCRQVFRTESIKYSYEIYCGIFRITNPRVGISAILDGAKLAEKSIRNNKRNQLFAYYDDSMKENYVKQRFLLSDFERALADNEFMPYYQPIVNAKTGEIVSAEMLIRWQHRDLGMVSPGDFIPIIESEGKTAILDKFMLESGIDFIERCYAAGKMAVPCAINLSRVDFYDSLFMENIFESIKGKKIEPAMVRFEVTESAYADLETKALEYLGKLKKHGIQILLDDYGSGMSSLSMLETFDFDIIKLDIGFIRKIGINKKSESIIISTIKLAHSIGAKVTAEGVENEKQLKFLQDADCDYIQGFYFYKPLPEAEFEKLLK
ncbi:EAL domain, c-di-GMP-specific phosphodiesterase class I (or its enzymatically inactive variant) [Butyrivibrio sp. ob235]|uniref:EAL domain-containing protein n=1 Tax=Butyrivibrio sp. ob235 TaxID=1761780 RepID=UPI0008BA5276|nr:EAL domain-containing protein [Butyrivibrio sp. ob235]SEL00912.1 EAL domain, c-di-GMP-specific phosphodiesterase class I (or its enzymatically inactive variant) [Butyrivibrio sp. ob235]